MAGPADTNSTSSPGATRGFGAAVSDVRGVARLAVAGVVGVTDVVEAMHYNISHLAPVVGRHPSGRTRGISGLVYRCIRGITRIVGAGIDSSLALVPTGAVSPSLQREAVVAVLNGVVGDHLAVTDNPLAIPMSVRRNGRPLELARQALADEPGLSGGRLLVLVHGLCMNDLQWNRGGHDHGAELAADLGLVPLYLHYNTGRAIAENGRQLAELLERLVGEWPEPVKELHFLAHSMGGLVVRSACRRAHRMSMTWRTRLGRLVCLGTPHHGAPLERVGHLVGRLLEVSPYSAPLAALGRVRSAGVQDLRRGLEITASDGGRLVPEVDDGVETFVVAATTWRQPGPPPRRLPGDGLVPVRSALGQHDDPRLDLQLPPDRRALVAGHGHLDLLTSPEVLRLVRGWLSG